MKIRFYWLCQDFQYWIDSWLCPPTYIENGMQHFRFPHIHKWLCKNMPDAW